jgi:rod shape-determining protein MreD
MRKASFKNISGALRIAIFAAILLVSYVVSGVPYTFFYAASPDFLLVFMVCIAMFMPPLPAGIFAVFAGLLKDIACASIFGFHGLIYLLCAVTVSLLIAFLIRRTFINAIITNAAAVAVVKFFYYFIYNVLFEKGGRIALFTDSVIPSVFLTILILPVYYFGFKYVNRKFGIED